MVQINCFAQCSFKSSRVNSLPILVAIEIVWRALADLGGSNITDIVNGRLHAAYTSTQLPGAGLLMWWSYVVFILSLLINPALGVYTAKRN